MKKFLIIFLLSIFLIGCTKVSVVEPGNNSNINILTSFYPVYLFAENIVDGAEGVTLKNLTLSSNIGCLHGYHLTTANMKDIENADIFIINGAGMEESFIDDIRVAYPDLMIIDTSIGVDILDNTFADEENPHIWLSVDNAKKQVQNIAYSLIEVDKENEEVYTSNYESYINKLNSLKEETNKFYGFNIVAMHDSLSYFADSTGLNIIDIVQNDEEDVPSPKRLQEIIENIKKNNVKAIFTEEQYSDKLPNMLSEEINVKVYTFDSITSGEGNKEEYIDRMKNNFDMLLTISR